MGLGWIWLFLDGLLPVPGYECVCSLLICFHSWEIHRNLPSNEGSGRNDFIFQYSSLIRRSDDTKLTVLMHFSQQPLSFNINISQELEKMKAWNVLREVESLLLIADIRILLCAATHEESYPAMTNITVAVIVSALINSYFSIFVHWHELAESSSAAGCLLSSTAHLGSSSHTSNIAVSKDLRWWVPRIIHIGW